MKTIDTLIEDIENLLDQGELDGDEYEGFGRRMRDVLERGLQPRDNAKPARVWFSNVGGPCTRKLWYKLHTPNDSEPLLPSTRLKFLYGDIIEELVLELARRAGHLVEHEQRRVERYGVSGRIDACIDGVLVDVKSASSFAFKKFQGGLRSEEDAFGYLGQLGGYLLVAREEGFVSGKNRNRAAFLAVNKETGKLHLDEHTFTDGELLDVRGHITDNKAAAEGDETPERAFEPVPEGKSGNLKLPTNCSYCDFKRTCWPGLRTFLYSNKPVFLTEVVREPNVYELKDG
jgi:hypothetical protein